MYLVPSFDAAALSQAQSQLQKRYLHCLVKSLHRKQGLQPTPITPNIFFLLATSILATSAGFFPLASSFPLQFFFTFEKRTTSPHLIGYADVKKKEKVPCRVVANTDVEVFTQKVFVRKGGFEKKGGLRWRGQITSPLFLLTFLFATPTGGGSRRRVFDSFVRPSVRPACGLEG